MNAERPKERENLIAGIRFVFLNVAIKLAHFSLGEFPFFLTGRSWAQVGGSVNHFLWGSLAQNKKKKMGKSWWVVGMVWRDWRKWVMVFALDSGTVSEPPRKLCLACFMVKVTCSSRLLRTCLRSWSRILLIGNELVQLKANSMPLRLVSTSWSLSIRLKQFGLKVLIGSLSQLHALLCKKEKKIWL